ncbi:helix-turn-helix transcriptional regulator [Mogibacterium sp. NSJ-24]|jgi:hypothetical protein|uniref:Helix-turn-helix transcriptional regulator n=2 Tax=Anaerovoracaceae TaxID=543314 RepID=A0A926E607_9FIRM|nr:helix-turn-helix transcriptional regulator [Lentihominibacter hominis]
MNQDELAAKIYITRSTYSAYETGSKVPDIQTLDALAAIYNIGFESLVNHDLSKGLLSRIYFDSEDRQLAELLNDYESLSVASKNVIMERLDVLLEREAVFYQEFAYPNKNMKK